LGGVGKGKKRENQCFFHMVGGKCNSPGRTHLFTGAIVANWDLIAENLTVCGQTNNKWEEIDFDEVYPALLIATNSIVNLGMPQKKRHKLPQLFIRTDSEGHNYDDYPFFCKEKELCDRVSSSNISFSLTIWDNLSRIDSLFFPKCASL